MADRESRVRLRLVSLPWNRYVIHSRRMHNIQFSGGHVLLERPVYDYGRPVCADIGRQLILPTAT